MKCPICGKQTLPGAKLCGPCRAALKRAKDDSVWELPPSQRPGEAELGQPRQAQWVLGTPRFASWRMWALGLAVLGICAFAGVQFARSGEPPVAAPKTAAAVTQPIVADPPPAPPQRAIPASAQLDGGTAAPTTTPPHADDALVQPPRHGEHPSAPRAPKSTRPVPEPAAPEIVPTAPSPPVEAPRPAPAPPPPVRPADPWQRMQEAMARCRAEDLFGRLGCEYRVRTSFCEGHWGEVAQCPAPVTNDHGQ